MVKRKVISTKNMPTILPLWPSLLTVLAMDYWNAPRWLWGAIGTFFVISWVAAIYDVWTAESEEILK